LCFNIIPLNILIIVSSLNIGGAERQAVNDANLLINRHKVFLVVFKDGLLNINLDNRVKYHVVDKVDYLRTALFFVSFIKKYHIDLIHASLFAPMIIGSLASIISRTSLYWNFHSHENNLPLKSKICYYLLSKSRLLKKIIYVNKELRFHFENSFLLPKEKGIVVFNNGTLDYQPKSIESKSIFIIGYVGRIVALKRVEYLIEVAKFLISRQIYNFSIHIVGDGSSRPLLEEQIVNEELQNYFVFFGFQHDLYHFYSQFDIFINPSMEECLSIALIDAGMNGIASIAFAVGGNDEIILKNETGYIVTTRDELIEKVHRLYTQPEIRIKMGKKASLYCNSMFSRQERLRKLNKLFDIDET
jgi:glycosyltransferase involved in cell wall biosynthesis